MHEPRRATLVVIEEEGASWPKWLHPCGSGDLVLVVRDRESDSLTCQVANRWAELEAIGWVIEKVVLVVGSRCEVDAIFARSILIGDLVARLESARVAELVLSSNEPAGSRAHDGLIALAAANEDLDLQITVRVGSEHMYQSPQPPFTSPAAL
jgi:hypothetical protein